MRFKIEALIKVYEAQIAATRDTVKFMTLNGLHSNAAVYQREIDIYQRIIADLNSILG